VYESCKSAASTKDPLVSVLYTTSYILVTATTLAHVDEL
jgi:hypothetical protein